MVRFLIFAAHVKMDRSLENNWKPGMSSDNCQLQDYDMKYYSNYVDTASFSEKGLV